MIIISLCTCKQKSADQPPTTRVLRLAHGASEHSSVHTAAVAYANQVDAATRGAVKIEIFPAHQLGDDRAVIEQARRGELDIAIVPTTGLTALVPAMHLLDVPFLISDRPAAEKLLDGRVGAALLDKLSAHGVTGVTYYEQGWKHFTSSFAIAAGADFAGKTFYTAPSAMIRDQFGMLDATAIPGDPRDLREALGDRAAVGHEAPIERIHDLKLHAVQSHLTRSRHGYLAQVVIFGNKALDALQPDQRKLAVDLARTSAAEQRKAAAARAQSLWTELGAIENLRVADLTAEAERELRSLTGPLLDDFEHVIGADLIEQAFADLGGRRPVDGTIAVALDADMSGASAVSGEAIRRGISLAIKHINARGGIDGKRLRLIVKDHQGVPARGVANIKQLVDRPNVKAVFGGLHSAIILAEMPVIAKLDRPYISSWATAVALTENDLKPNPVFRVSANDRLVGEFLVRQAARRSERVAMLLENSAWGRGNESSFTKALAALGLSPSSVQYFNSGDKEFLNQLKAIEQSGAGVILLAANPAEGKGIIRTMMTRATKLPLISHWGITGGTFGEDLATELQTIDLRFFQTFSFLDSERPEAAALAAAYLETYGVKAVEDIEAPDGMARSYDAMRLLGAAMEIAARDKISLFDALPRIETHSGVITTYDEPFANGGHEGLDPAVYRFGKFDRNGRIVPAQMN